MAINLEAHLSFVIVPPRSFWINNKIVIDSPKSFWINNKIVIIL